MLEREFKRLGVNDANLEQLARRKKYNKTDELLASIGRGDLKISQVIATIQERSSDLAKREESPRSEKRGQRTAAESIKIQGVGNLLTRMAACCKPVPGDPVIGYITRGRGVTIHRRDCANALRLQGQASERIVEVDWGSRLDATYPVDIEVVAYDRPGLLRDVSAIVASENINVAAVQTLTDKRDQTARMKLTLEITDIQKLSRVLAKLNQLPNVADVRRRLP
jgi:GTP pyrophosphokinase